MCKIPKPPKNGKIINQSKYRSRKLGKPTKNKKSNKTESRKSKKPGSGRLSSKAKFSDRKNLRDLLLSRNRKKNKNLEKNEKKKFDPKVLEFKCNSGYRLKGQRILKCSNGKWNGKVPSCIRSGKSNYFYDDY